MYTDIACVAPPSIRPLGTRAKMRIYFCANPKSRNDLSFMKLSGRLKICTLSASRQFGTPKEIIPFVLVLLTFAGGCGYRVTNSVKGLPTDIHSLGVPTFRNLTNQYKLEQQISQALLQEFASRTRFPVNSNSSDVDAVLLGEIRSASSSPVTFGTDTFGSAFLVTVQIGVKLVRLKDGKVLWENPDYLFRERYVFNSKVIDFFSEEGPALERLAREFAASLVSTVLNQ